MTACGSWTRPARPARQILGAIGGLNGFDVGEDGMIYGPLWFKHQVVRIDPDSGEIAVISDDFGTPAAANFDSHGNLYVVDTQRGELARLDVARGEKKLIAKVSPSLDNLAIDAHDRIFISNMADNGIQEIDPETGVVRQVTLGKLAIPYSIAALSHHDGDELIVADLFAFRSVHTATGRVQDIERVWASDSKINYTLQVSANDRHIILVNTQGLVQQYDSQTYELIRSWTLRQAWGALEMPEGTIVALDSNGQVFRLEDDDTATSLAADLGRYSVLALAGPETLYVAQPATGDLLLVDLKDGSHRTVASGLQRPQGIAVAGDGTVVVVEMGPQRVSTLDPATGVRRVIARDLPLAIPGRSSSPVGVTVGTGGAIYVTSAWENSIYRLRQTTR